MKSIIVMLVACFAMVCAGSAQAVPVIDDEFDDGAIGTNTLGLGDGFTVTMQAVNSGASLGGSSVTESGGLARLFADDPGASGGAGPQNLVDIFSSSNDTAMADGVTAKFYVDASSTEPSNRVVFQLSHGASGDADYFRLTLSLHGSNGTNAGGVDYRNDVRLRAADSGNPAAVDLITPHNHNLDWASSYTVTLFMDATGYSATYDDGAGPGLDETFSGNWADTVVGFHNLAMTVSTRAQANGDGTVLLNVDRITLDGTPPGGGVTPAIPEPASLGLVGLALMGLAGSRRNRR